MITVTVEAERITVRSPYSCKDALKAIPGARWDKEARCWAYPRSAYVVEHLREAFPGEAIPSWDGTGSSPMPALLTQPWEHQVRAFEFAMGKEAAMLGMDLGTGKTLAAIALLAAWDARRTLVICPKAVVSVWPGQFRRHVPEGWFLVAPLVAGSVSRKRDLAERFWHSSMPVVYVINYESVWREPFATWALNKEWDVLCLDEAHRVKAPGGRASRFCAKLRDKARRRLALTGTPMPHSPLDVYGPWRTLDPGLFGTSFQLFRSTYAVMGGYGNYQVVRWINQEKMQRELARGTFRVTKRDVLTLPPTVDEEVTFALSPKERKVYDALEKDFYAWLEEGQEVTVTNALTKLLRLGQVCGGQIIDDEGKKQVLGTSKADAFADWLEDLPQGKPLVVFHRFTHDGEEIQKACLAAGRSCAMLSGHANELADWQAGKADVLIAQIQSGSEGIDLTRAAYCVMYSMGFSLGQHEQAKARLDRPGQTRSVTYVYLLAERTVDVKVLAALKARKDVVRSFLEKGGR